MSHGKISRKQQSGQSTLDRLNRRLAWLLGKRDNKSFRKIKQPTSDKKFLGIIIAMILFLWALTGVYYVPQKSYGIILHNGKFNKVMSGFVIGVDYPYPFSDVLLLDSNLSIISIGKTSSGDNTAVISSDNEKLQISAEVSYHLADPRQYFLFHYQENSNSDQVVKWLIQSMIQSYVSKQNSDKLLHASTIVTANEIRNQSDVLMNSYGLKVDKLTITSLSKKLINSPSNESTANIGQQSGNYALEIINQANLYAQNKARETKVLVDNFNELLPQYLANPEAITQLMYYKMLNDIPHTESDITYPLLKLNPAQFNDIAAGKDIVSKHNVESDPRVLNRSVDRERVFRDR